MVRLKEGKLGSRSSPRPRRHHSKPSSSSRIESETTHYSGTRIGMSEGLGLRNQI